MSRWVLQILFFLFLVAFGVVLGIDSSGKDIKESKKPIEEDTLPYYVSRIENGKMIKVSKETGIEITDSMSELSSKKNEQNAAKETSSEITLNQEGSLSKLGNQLGNFTTDWTRLLLEKSFSFLEK